ncbi:MAG: hypothetical protein JWN07_2853 [Hyphomicrobiales bacterium]|nr:hypothetical protein [Hyphomicrobiales bacterium]
MARFLVLAAAAAPLLFAGSASAMTMAPLSAPSNVTEARTVCDPYGRCCATGSGECFYQGRPRRQVYVQRPQRYYAPPAYGYRERYEPRYYGGPGIRFGY